MSILRRAFGAERRGATGPWGDTSPPSPGATGGIVRSTDALRVSTFMSCCLAVSEDTAMLPLGAYRHEGPSVVPASSAPAIIADPFSEADTRISSQAGRAQIVMSLLLRGNAYMSVVARGWQGTPTALIVLSPDVVNVRIDQRTGLLEYRVSNQVVDPETIVHILGPSLPGAFQGLSIVEYERVTFALAMGADDFGASWFENGVSPSGLLEVQRALSRKEARDVKDVFMAGNAGTSKAGGVGVLSGGTKYTPLTLKPQDAQFLETSRMTDERICGLVGVPPHRVGIVGSAKGGSSGGPNLEAQALQYRQQTLMRWTSRLEHAWTRMLPGGATFAMHDWSELLRADSATRWANYLIGRTIGATTNAEIRAAEGQPPINDPSMSDPAAPLNSAHTLQGSAGPGAGADDPSANGHRPDAITRALLARSIGQEN